MNTSIKTTNDFRYIFFLSYFKSINKLNFSSKQQLVLQLWMYHLQGMIHRVIVDIWIANRKMLFNKIQLTRYYKFED